MAQMGSLLAAAEYVLKLDWEHLSRREQPPMVRLELAGRSNRSIGSARFWPVFAICECPFSQLRSAHKQSPSATPRVKPKPTSAGVSPLRTEVKTWDHHAIDAQRVLHILAGAGSSRLSPAEKWSG